MFGASGAAESILWSSFEHLVDAPASLPGINSSELEVANSAESSRGGPSQTKGALPLGHWERFEGQLH